MEDAVIFAVRPYRMLAPCLPIKCRIVALCSRSEKYSSLFPRLINSENSEPSDSHKPPRGSAPSTVSSVAHHECLGAARLNSQSEAR